MLNFQKFGCFETLILFVKCNIQRNHLLRKYNQKYSKIFKNVQNIDFIDCLSKVVRNEQVVNSLLWIIPEKCFCIKVKLVALRFLTLLISHRSNVSFNLKILSGADPEQTCDFSKFEVWKNVGHYGGPTDKIFDFRWTKTVLKCISSL